MNTRKKNVVKVKKMKKLSSDGSPEFENTAIELTRIERLKDSITDLRNLVTRDVMSVLFNRHELAKPSSSLVYNRVWLTTFVSEPIIMYKSVATAKVGKLLSIYDGETEYNIGRKLLSKRGSASWPPINCCFFCYPTIHQAILATLPLKSKLRYQPRVIIKLLCQGRAYVHNNLSNLSNSNTYVNRKSSQQHKFRIQSTSSPQYSTRRSERNHIPVVKRVNGQEYNSDDFDIWAFSEVIPITIFKDIIQIHQDEINSLTNKENVLQDTMHPPAFKV